MTTQYGQRRRNGLRRTVKYRLRQLVSALLAFSMVTGGMDLTALTVYAEESAVETTVDYDYADDIETADAAETADDIVSVGDEGYADAAFGEEPGYTADTADESTGEGSVSEDPRYEDTDEDSENINEGYGDAGTITVIDSNGAGPSDDSDADGAGNIESINSESESTDLSYGDASNSDAVDHTGDILPDVAEPGVPSDDEENAVFENVDASEDAGLGSGVGAGEGVSEGNEALIQAEAEAFEELASEVPQQQVLADENLFDLEEDQYQAIRAEIIGGDIYDDEDPEEETLIRVIGRLPDGAYAVAYPVYDEDGGSGTAGTGIDLAGIFGTGQFAITGFDITVYDETGTSLDIAPEQPVMVEIITPEIRKAVELDAPLYAWYQSAADEMQEQIGRASRGLDKESFFHETTDGDVIDLEDLLRSEYEAAAAEEEIDWEALGYAVYSRDQASARNSRTAGTAHVASPSDYEEDDYDADDDFFGDDEDLFEDDDFDAAEFSDNAMAAEAAETAAKIDEGLDRIRLSKDAFKFEYTAFGIYSVTTDDARMLPLTEQQLEAEIYTSSDYTVRTEEDTMIRLSGMLPVGGVVRAYPVELDVTDGIVLAAYDISIFRADGSLYEPGENDGDAAADVSGEEGEILVEIDSPALREAMAENRQFGVLHLTDGTDLYTGETIPVSNALSEAETGEMYALLQAEAEEAYYETTAAAFERKYEEETLRLEASLEESVGLRADSADSPETALRSMKAAHKALGAVTASGVSTRGALGSGQKSPAVPQFDIEAMYSGHEKMEDLPPSVSDALDNAVFVREAPIGFRAKAFSVYAIVGSVLTKTITASDGNVYIVNVTYDTIDGIPAGTELHVSEIEQGTEDYNGYIEESADLLGIDRDRCGFARALDIWLEDPATGEHVTPSEDVKVSISLLKDDLGSENGISVVHFGDEAVPMDCTITDGTVEFETSGFSVYVVIDHEGGEVVTPRVKFHFISNVGVVEVDDVSGVYYKGNPYQFKNKKGDDQTTQILKDDEALELIEDPSNQDPDYFFGWYMVTPHVISGTTDEYGIGTSDQKLYYTWPANPERITFESPITITAGTDLKIGDTVKWSLSGASGSGAVDKDGNVHVFLAPVFRNYHFVNFMLRPRNASGSNNLMTRKLVALGSASSAEVKISDVCSNSTDPVHLIFTGWEYKDTASEQWITKQTLNYSGEPLADPGKDGVYLSISDETDLYPVFIEARWVDFFAGVSGSGASYVASRFLESWGRATETNPPEDIPGRNVFTDLSTSSRTGYDFDGWYAFAKTDPVTGEITNLDVPDDVTISYLILDGNNYVTNTVTVNTTAVKVTNADGSIFNCGTWSITDNGDGTGTLNNDTSGNKLFEASDGKLRFFDSLDRLKLSAKWASAGSKITVVYWTENAQDKGYSAPQDPKDDYTASAVKVITTEDLNSQSGTIGATFASGSTLTLEQLQKYKDGTVGVLDRTYLDDIGAVLSGEEKFYDLDTGLSDPFVDIKGDGSTTINVFFSRKIFKLVFHIGRDGYVKNGGHQKTDDHWDGNWIEFMYNDSKVHDLGYPTPGGTGRNPAQSILGKFTMTYLPDGETYTSEYVTTPENVMGDYDPVSDDNLYVLEAKYGAYIGDRWPTPTNPNFSFTDAPGKNKTLYIWAAYYGSLYCRIANERSIVGNPQGANPDINGVYEYMSAELCSNRAGDDIINDNQVHHLVAYFGNSNNSNRYKQYHILREAIPGTYDPAEIVVQGDDYAPYELTTWSLEHTAGDKSEILGHSFIEVADSPKPIISNLEPQFQLTDTLEGYELVYSCYDPTQRDSSTIEAQKDYHIYFFYTPKQYTLTFNLGSETRSDYYAYNRTLADANKYTDEVVVPEGYYFSGWYTNAEGVGEPFDFANEKMPGQNVVLYPVLRVLQYTVKIDPNGGVIDHRANASVATYFTADYATPIGEYSTERGYIKLTDKELTPGEPGYYTGTKYYYINTQRLGILSEGYWGLPTDLRNAVYVPESDLDAYYNWYANIIDTADPEWWSGISKLSKEDFIDQYTSYPYRPLSGGEHYTFMGWYQVFDDGTVASMPYNFNDPVKGPLELRALWRLDGGYYIQYNPYYLVENGETVTEIVGEVQQWTDPENTNMQLYADQSPTHVLRAPTNITEGWVFRGWRVVRANGIKKYQGQEYINWEPFGEEIYYQPGDAFTIDSELVSETTSTGKVIHMQAYYEPQASTYRRPDITNLVLDANDMFGGYVNTDDSSALPPLTGPGSTCINTTTELYEGHPTQILLGDFQSNIDLHLYQYATNKTFNDKSGHNFFTNENGYLLIGFDENSDPNSPTTEKAFIPAFTADSVASVTRHSDEVLYALWEPMVYVTFVNTTESPITVNLTGTGAQTVSVVNEVTGEFDREANTTTFTIPEKSGDTNGSVKIVLPCAVAGTDAIIATAKNDHIQRIMSVSGEYPEETEHGTGSSNIKYGENATYTGTLVNDPEGIIVTYTEEPVRQQIFDVNGGVWTEISTYYEHLENDLYAIDQADIIDNKYRPEDPTRSGKVFICWTTNPDIAEHTDFSSIQEVIWGSTTITPSEGSNVLDEVKRSYLWDFDQLPPYEQTLYAVWSDTVTVTFNMAYSKNLSVNPLKLHIWNGPDVTNIQTPYAFYRSEDKSPFITYTMAKGDRVHKPEDPSAHLDQPNWHFIKWLQSNGTTDSYRHNNKEPSDGNLTTYAFDFSKRITNDEIVVTSWTENAPQTFTFTVENHVIGGNVNDEFDYTIAVTDELVLGKLGSSTSNSVGIPDRRYGSITTKLKNNQQYTVLVTVSYITNWGGANSVRIDVVDREGVVIKSGEVIYCNKNTYKNFVSDYKYTLTVTQEAKAGYDTTVGIKDPVGSITCEIDGTSNSFIFKSCESRTTIQEVYEYFKDEVNEYDTGVKNNSLTVEFTNTGARYVAPTAYHESKKLFTCLLLISLFLSSMAALPVWYRKRRNGGGADEL